MNAIVKACDQQSKGMNPVGETTMFMNLNKSGRILGVAFALAVIIPVGMAEAAAGRGGRGGGGGGNGGGGDGDGGKKNPVLECLGGDCSPKILVDYPDYPKVTYVVKKQGCEIRTCEIEAGVRKCSTDLADIKVCATKRS
jgi:hypothetical protein